MGIRRNENADTAAKVGLVAPISNMRFPVSDLLTCVNQLCAKEWQHLWSQCTSNKLYSVQPVIGCNRNPSLSRYDVIIIIAIMTVIMTIVQSINQSINPRFSKWPK